MVSYPYLVNTRILHSATEVLLACDVKPTTVLKRIGLPPSVILTPDAWISNRVLLALAAEAARATGDQFYAVHAGEQFRFERTGVWGERILKASTLRAAFQACIGNIRLFQTDSFFRLHEEGRTARFTLQILGHGPHDARPYYEAFGVVFQKIPALTGERAPITVWMKHARPSAVSKIEHVMGSSLRFNAPDNALVFDRELLDLPLRNSLDGLPSAPPPIEWASADPVARAVVETISKCIEYEVPSIQGTAATLGLQMRTLQRHLERWGTTFEMLLDDFRRERAIHLLRTASHTVTDIALLLGYSDLPHFSRAFRRWTGMAPRDYIMQRGKAPARMFSLNRESKAL